MIGAYQTDTVIRHIAALIDEWNEPGVSTTEEIKAHVVHQTKLIYNTSGEEVSSPTQVLVKPDQAMEHKDRIQLDGESFTHPIINIFQRRHMSIEFKEIFLEPGTGRTV